MTDLRIRNFGTGLDVHTALRANAGAAQRRQHDNHDHVWTVRQESDNGCATQLHFSPGFTTNRQGYNATQAEGRQNVLHAGYARRIHKHQTIRSHGRFEASILVPFQNDIMLV